ncbi:pyruvate kinase [Halanaerobiaceae bacterium Z-7014]|uniref:Pyruvate kinase n=1 Tax=Halonatronomonas betaini TaxID=2778430 RepID=A0A931F9I4_9FIRM|nr:pyruvate kinase [Halonatronomonas betaini]MBF8436499.1 pyruvate kinase [Halonatronomonas betaini]
MRKTKIVCTLGPASNDKETIMKMAEAGMNVARFNFSHGDHAEQKARMDMVKEVEKEFGKPIGIMLDTKGPEIRTGVLKDDKVELVEGEEIVLTTEEIEGDKNRVSVTYKKLNEDLQEGSVILIDDGLIELNVNKIEGNDIYCEIINGGELGSRKGVNLPGVKVQLPALTDKDRKDILLGVEEEVHFIAASFVRKASDVLEIRKLLEENGAEDINIVPKIENEEGVENIDEIIEVSDGIMVARGDLGVEIPTEKVPVIQKLIIEKCNEAAIPVITATQMLDSMIRNPRPTRAEASDVANAIVDGTDAIMLSGESAAGKYPVESVETMARIAMEMENSQAFKDKMSNRKPSSKSTTESISFAACETAVNLDADALLTATGSGLTARVVSKFRPFIKIIAATPSIKVQHFLTLTWGVYPLISKFTSSTDEMIDTAIDAALEHGLIELGNLITITAGAPTGMPGTTNLIKVEVVGKPLIEGIGVGRGIVTGNVVIANTADEANERVKEGDILVTEITDKGFIPAMEKAAAVITSKGGLTSHPAIVGLNFGMPVVVGVGEDINSLEDGEEVTLDGIRGLVYKGKAHLR